MKTVFGDHFILALTIWREASNQGLSGQVAVGCVLRNRAMLGDSSIYETCVERNQFSSMTTKGDPNTVRWPTVKDPTWLQCQQTALDIISGKIADVTNGAHFYENPQIATSEWFTKNIVENPTEHPKTATIGAHVFYK